MAKKKMLVTLSVLSLGLVSYVLFKPAIAETTSGITRENKTIEIYKDLPDSQLIIADKSGGYTTSLTDDYSNPVESTDENGNEELKSFHDKSVAATVGEIKEALK